MAIEESGTVVEVRDRTALVRVRRTAACQGCAAAGRCHTGQGKDEQVIEARNDANAGVGDEVRVAISTGAVLGASARIYVLPVIGLLAGAAAAQALAGAFSAAGAADGAAGIGGIAGAVCGALIARRLGLRAAVNSAALPRITRRV